MTMPLSTPVGPPPPGAPDPTALVPPARAILVGGGNRDASDLGEVQLVRHVLPFRSPKTCHLLRPAAVAKLIDPVVCAERRWRATALDTERDCADPFRAARRSWQRRARRRLPPPGGSRPPGRSRRQWPRQWSRVSRPRSPCSARRDSARADGGRG